MQSTNFEFLRNTNEVLANLGGLAEAVLFIDPGSALTRLRGFAEEVTKSIYKEEQLPRLPQSSFYELIKSPVFEATINKSLIYQINALRVQGNDTAHGAKGDLRNAQIALSMAHQIALFMAIRYYGFKKADIPDFIDIDNPNKALKQLKKSVSKYQKELDKKQEEMQAVLDDLDKARLEASKKLKEPTVEEQQQRKLTNEQVADSLQWDEAKTRKILIDALLAQADWDVNHKSQVGTEVEVDFPNNPSGKGYVDYVLWGKDGEPLAVVEAKRSSETNLQAGREQARLYADALENMGHKRPILFYTNGYETFIWDDQQYNTYRRIYGFYNKDSLDYLIFQRSHRSPNLEQNNPDLSIADRPYQIEAIKKVSSHFSEQRRQALIVQATGTGKTRVAIALSELLTRMHWAKRILFLCDRKELRSQANDAFKEHLPSEPRCVIKTGNKIDKSARIYVATYPGMMNRFTQLDVGFFDLIIADESHRSIYNRYRDLFDYFDALQLGLTATPVKFIARNTFDLFGCENTDPTFEFGLDQAINNDPAYLVPFRVKDLTTEFLREGIHYKDLTEEQKRQLEKDLGEEEAQKTTIKGKDIGRRIYSESTDKIILENLMNNGLKDETNSLVGKTIIFAQNQKHAEQLEKLFAKLYPQYGTKVCKVIHNKIPHVESLIKEFKKPDNAFRIAISVDMLDTGIDVPQIVNLVFARAVKSWVKFWQMIGRGTRLCKNLYGPNKDKTEFYIFDHYSNFKYFDEEYQETEETISKSLLQTLFEARIELAETALKINHKTGFDTGTLLLREDINDLPQDSLPVKRNLREVLQIQQSDQLETLSATTIHSLKETIAPLMGSRTLHDKYAIQFDRLIATLQCCLIQKASCFQEGRIQLLAELDNLAVNIQAVRQKDALIEEIRTSAFWATVDVPKLEYVRQELRGIMQYRKSKEGTSYLTPTTSTEDIDIKVTERKASYDTTDEARQYRRRIKKILDDMFNSSKTLQKIHNSESIKPEELKSLVSSILTQHPDLNLDQLNTYYGRTAEQLHITLRELIGLDPSKVEQHFTAFLHAHPTLTAKQVQFMNMLKNHIATHGSITIDKLYEAPFNRLSNLGIDGIFKPSDVDSLVSVLNPFLQPETDTEAMH